MCTLQSIWTLTNILFFWGLHRIFHLSLTRIEPYRNQGHKIRRHLPQVEAGASAGLMSWRTQLDATQTKSINQHPIMDRIKPESQRVWAQLPWLSFTFWPSLKIPNLSEPQTFIWKTDEKCPCPSHKEMRLCPWKYFPLYCSGQASLWCTRVTSNHQNLMRSKKVYFPHSQWQWGSTLHSPGDPSWEGSVLSAASAVPLPVEKGCDESWWTLKSSTRKEGVLLLLRFHSLHQVIWPQWDKEVQSFHEPGTKVDIPWN